MTEMIEFTAFDAATPPDNDSIEAARMMGIERRLNDQFAVAMVLRYPRKVAAAPYVTATGNYVGYGNEWDGYESVEDRNLAIHASRIYGRLKRSHREVIS